MSENIHQFEQKGNNPTPRQLLTKALQDVDQFDGLIIIAAKKTVVDERETMERFASGMAGLDRFTAIGMLEAFKYRLLG